MDEAGILEHGQALQKLLREDAYELEAEALELVLLDELVQVRRETLEHKAQVALVRERVVHAQDVMLVARVVLSVEEVEDRDLHLGLIQVCGLVLDDFDGTDLVRTHVLALDDLPKCTLAENVENQVPVATVLAAEDVVDIQDVVPVLIIRTVIVHRLGRLGEHAPRVVRRLVLERRVTQRVRLRQRRREALERLF